MTRDQPESSAAGALHAVLTYHAVGPARDRGFAPWTVSEAQLAEQLEALQQAGYRLESLVGALKPAGPAREEGPVESAKPVVAVTFDDGYADFAERALPLLGAAGARSTLFVVTDFVGRSAGWLPFEAEQGRPLLSWEEIEQVAQAGTEIGSHGCRHLELDTVDVRTAREEVQRSHQEISDHIGAPDTFAYPFGYHNDQVRGMVAAAGYLAGCEVGRGLFDPAADRYRVRRLLVDQACTPEALVERLAGPPQLLADRLRELARPAWRAWRTTRPAARSGSGGAA